MVVASSSTKEHHGPLLHFIWSFLLTLMLILWAGANWKFNSPYMLPVGLLVGYLSGKIILYKLRK